LHAVPESRQSPESHLGLFGPIREWRIDRKADRVARRPSGRRARAIYGSPTSHDFLWPQLLEALQLKKDDSLLDVGCGGGAFLRHVRDTVGCTVAGVDHSHAMVRLARPLAVEADAAELPFPSDSFTAISSIQAFMFFPDPMSALREMHRVGGRIALWTTAPEGRGTPAAPEPIASRAHLYNDEQLLELVRTAGFTDVALAVREEWAQLLVAQP
jgi:SAM-dependent methyltransferase